VRVLVVGEFKQGKSSLVNALVDQDVCPVDDDIATSAPTVVRFAEAPEASVVHEPEGDAAPQTEQIAVDEVAAYASEAGNPGNERRLRAVEVGVNHALLSSGLVLVDTPGVGGLGSVHSAVTMAALPMADALVFVTDASQEMSQPELDFLRRARDLCPNVVGVVTKTDFYPEWRRIIEIDHERLRAAGIELTLLPVSSILHGLARAAGDEQLDGESGLAALVDYLRDEVIGHAQQLTVRTAAYDVMAVAGQLETQFASERAALEDPARAQELVRELEQAQAKAERLQTAAARWQITLSDGIIDLNGDSDHDMRTRVRGVIREAEEAIDTYDPAEIWEEFEPWLYRRVAEESAACFTTLARKADDLADRVAEHFREAVGEVPVPVDIASPTSTLDQLAVAAGLETKKEGWAAKGMTAMRGGYGGVLMFGMLGSMAGLALVNPLTIGVGLLMGRKTLKDEKERQLMMTRQQGKQVVRRYLDEVQFAVGKDLRDTLRDLQRQLRDTFSGRAQELNRTATEAAIAAQQAQKTSGAEREKRLAEVDAELGKIGQLRARALLLAPDLAPSDAAPAPQ
jgi:hypothetical protein